ncbi:DUF4340 domain-containing protein [Hyalangium sp.]|uniref:DUF4340 domain-containing protein n=1 Tax=Hyalangium sp. TaxID=2028555 RepID=UPI002D406318|nr:DUF4340 domain-containing protein [Hyalangium sp.]HYI01490.1 DUF4340 domain-containing protein [Hyalangium sp.]
MKQTQKTLIALLAATVATAGLGLYAYFGVKQPEEAQAARKEQSEKLFAPSAPGEKPDEGGTPAPVFTQLTVKAQGVTATLEQQGDTWRLTAPVLAKADKWAVEGILSQLQSGKFKATVEEAPTDADLEKYGLKPPVFSVTAKAYVPEASGGGKEDPARQRTVTLHGGIENPFDGSVYVRRDEDPRVYSADGSVRYALEKDLYALRDKEILALDEASLKALEVVAKANSYSLERDSDQSWRLTKPAAVRADGDRLKQALKSLKEQRALSFPTDSAQERTRLGLDKPVLDAHFTLDKGEPVRLRLSQVKEGAGSKVYALLEQGSEVTLAEVPEGTLAVLELGLADLRTKMVLSFKREDVKRLVFHPGDGGTPIVLANAKPDSNSLDGWQVEAPKAGKAQGFRVASLLSHLHTLKASTFGEANPRKWDKYGITDASRGASLQDADGKELARLWIGSAVPGKEGFVYIRGSNAEVAEVELARLADLPARPEDILEASPTAATDGGATMAQP